MTTVTISVVDVSSDDVYVDVHERLDGGRRGLGERTSTNWSDTINVPLSGIDESTVDGDTTTVLTVVVAAASDPDFLTPTLDHDISVTTLDDDDAGFTFAETAGSTDVTDAPTQDSFTVVLDARPQTPVTINVTSGAPGEATVDFSSLTFQPANWDTPQTITVSGVFDGVPDADQVVSVTLSVDDASSDDAFDGLADQVVSVNVTNTDAQD